MPPNSGSWKPAHQNKFAFRHNKNSKKTKKILALPNEGLCRTCTEQIEWRKKYRKYKPMTQPASCIHCHQRTVVRSYHVMCDACAVERKCCAKCQLVGDVKPRVAGEVEEDDPAWIAEQEMLARMKERERRTYLRKKEKEERAQRIAERRARAAAKGIDLSLADAQKEDDAETGRVPADDDDDDDLDDDLEGDDDDDDADDDDADDSAGGGDNDAEHRGKLREGQGGDDDDDDESIESNPF